MKKIALIAALLVSTITGAAAAPGTATPGYPQDHSWNMDDHDWQNDGGGGSGS